MSDTSEKKEDFYEEKYDLYGIIVHSGYTRGFGHYYSFCRAFESDDMWYKCDDSHINRIGGVDSALSK